MGHDSSATVKHGPLRYPMELSNGTHIHIQIGMSTSKYWSLYCGVWGRTFFHLQSKAADSLTKVTKVTEHSEETGQDGEEGNGFQRRVASSVA